jgi:NAD(P)-dependent dehydrogenase (short-subunit alcohol dehydrogenase family)
LQDLFSLQQKLIVVTGASSGIGRSTAIACAQMGAKLLLVGRNPVALAQTKALCKNPDLCETLLTDLTHYDDVTQAIKSSLPLLGKIDGVVHAAGVSTTLPFRNVTPAKLLEFFEINVNGALHLTQQLLKPAHVSEKGASVIFLTSVMAIVGESAKLMYCTSKGALAAAAKSLALELATKKIRVNCIAPGVVDSPMTQKAYYSQQPELKERIIGLHPLGLGTPDDVAGACVYLLSDASRWVTGTQLVIDGGYTAR